MEQSDEYSGNLQGRFQKAEVAEKAAGKKWISTWVLTYVHDLTTVHFLTTQTLLLSSSSSRLNFSRYKEKAECGHGDHVVILSPWLPHKRKKNNIPLPVAIK